MVRLNQAPFAVPEGTANNHHKVDEGPDAKSAKSKNHQNARAHFPHVKSMYAQSPKEATEQYCGHESFIAVSTIFQSTLLGYLLSRVTNE